MKWVGYSKIDSKENSVHSVLGIILDSNYSEIKKQTCPHNIRTASASCKLRNIFLYSRMQTSSGLYYIMRVQTNPHDKQQHRTITACGCEIYYRGNSRLKLKVKARLYDKMVQHGRSEKDPNVQCIPPLP